MKWLVALLLLLYAPLAQASTVTIVSGEHDTFSRLVLTLPVASDWQLGRTATGYELLIAQTDLRYDVSKVFDLIPRDRLSGIFTDPRSGNLQLNVQCDCHAIPFSLDAQTIVIDIRDGPAPATSSFELTLAGAPLPPLQTRATPRPREDLPPAADAPGYDWLAQTGGNVTPVLPILPEEDFTELQQALVEQMAEGAARGVVDLAVPERTNTQDSQQSLPEDSQLRLTDIAGMRVASQGPSAAMMQPDGEACITDDRLKIAEWGQVTDVPGQLARARHGLVGEFDHPDGAAVSAQTRLYIFLGFGAEATALLAAMPPDDADARLWSAMAQIVDTQTVAVNAFDGMAHCDSAAALWALLSTPPDAPEMPNVAALQRTFSALPRHLRLTLGPQIAERLLTLDQPAAVQGIVDAMARGVTAPDARILLAESDLNLHNGTIDAAIADANAALKEGGVAAPEAMIALVKARIAAGEPVDPSVAVALAAMIDENAGSPLAAKLDAAQQLALIGSGQFAPVFSRGGDQVPSVVWDVLAKRGTDDQLLQFAFVVPDTGLSNSAATVISQRLKVLGFPDAAKSWHDRALMLPITGDSIRHADEPIQTAQGSSAAAASAEPVADSSLPDEATRARRWQQDWSAIATAEGDSWKDLAAQVVSPKTAVTEPPLAEATRLVEGSKMTRDLIQGLLQSTGSPGG